MSEKEDIMNILFKNVISASIKNKIISNDFEPNEIIFNILRATNKKRAKIFHESAIKINYNVIEKENIIQITKNNMIYYTLSFKGIIYCIKNRYNIDYEKQFFQMLSYFEEELTSITKPKPLTDKEKLASFSIILINSISPNTAIKLNNKTNQEIFENFLQELISILIKFNIINSEFILTQPSRNESKSSALMARLDKLPIKTNNIYKNLKSDSGYYFDFEKNNDIDSQKLNFILDLIFHNFNLHIQNIDELYNLLFDLSMKYNLKFLERQVDNRKTYEILKQLKNYLELDIFLNRNKD